MKLKTRGKDTLEQILEIVNFSERTFYHTQCHKRVTGSVAKAQAIGRGCPQKLLFVDIQYLLRLAQHKPTLFLDEYAKKLEEYRFLPASLATIHRAFRQAGLSVKQAQKLASERDPDKRTDFVHCMGQYPPTYLVMID